MQPPSPAARSPAAPSPAALSPAVLMRGIHKRFGAVQANRDVTLSVSAGTVHGIVGENGAGKSTLMSILYGFYQADAGTIEIEGRPAVITGSKEAIALGIGMVHQHFMLVDPLSALDNITAAGNGVYRYGVGGGFPNLSFNGSNYWVDVVFST